MLSYDHGAVAVIDGQTVKVTPFRVANIPPPMSLHDISLPANAIDVSFNVDASMIAVLHQRGFSLFEWKNISGSSPAPALIGRYTYEGNEKHLSTFQQVSFADENDVITLQSQGSKSIVERYGFDDETGRMERKSSLSNLPSSLSSISSFNESGSILPFAQDISGNLHSLLTDDISLSHCGTPVALPWVEIIPYNESYIAFGMSSNGNLYANSRLLIKNCTSFLLTSAHLIFTTTTHLVKFVHIADVDGKVLI